MIKTDIEIDLSNLSEQSMDKLVTFIEPLCFLAHEANVKKDLELEEKIQACIDHIYAELGQRISKDLYE